MTDRQRKILVDAFLLLAAGARSGKRKAETETASQVLEHVGEMESMIAELKKGLESHLGADHVLAKVPASALPSLHAGRRPLASTRPR